MAARLLQKINRKEHETVAFLGLRKFPKRKTVSRLEANSLVTLVKVMTKKKVKRDKKTLAMSLVRR